MKVGERQICISVINISSHLSLEFSSSFSSRNLDFQKRSPNVSEVNAVRHSDILRNATRFWDDQEHLSDVPDTPLPISPGRGLYSWTAVRWRSSTAASRKRGRQLFPYRPILRSKKVIGGVSM